MWSVNRGSNFTSSFKIWKLCIPPMFIHRNIPYSIHSDLQITLMQSSPNFQWHCFIEMEKTILKLRWNHKTPWAAKTTLRKDSGVKTSPILILKYITKWQQLKRYGTGKKKWTCRLIKQNRQPRNEPRHLWSTDLQQGYQEYTMEKGSLSSTNGAWKTEDPQAKEWTWILILYQTEHF